MHDIARLNSQRSSFCLERTDHAFLRYSNMVAGTSSTSIAATLWAVT